MIKCYSNTSKLFKKKIIMKKQIHKIMLMDLKFIRKYINNKTIKFILFIVVLFGKIKQSSAHYMLLSLSYIEK